MSEREGPFVVVSVVVDYSNGVQKVFSAVTVRGAEVYAGEAVEAAAALTPGFVLEGGSDRAGRIMIKTIDGLGGDGSEWCAWLDQKALGGRLPNRGTVGDAGPTLQHGQTVLVKLVAKPEPQSA